MYDNITPRVAKNEPLHINACDEHSPFSWKILNIQPYIHIQTVIIQYNIPTEKCTFVVLLNNYLVLHLENSIILVNSSPDSTVAKASASRAVFPGSILRRVTAKTVNEGVTASLLGIQHHIPRYTPRLPLSYYD